MLKIHDPSHPGELLPLHLDGKKQFVTHSFDGMDTLTFEISQKDPLYKSVFEEVRIEDEKNRYAIKTVDERSDFVIVRCDLDLADWERDLLYEFRTTGKTLTEVLQLLLPPEWSVEGDSAFSQRTTVEKFEGVPLQAVNPLEVLPNVSKAYGCVFNFEVLSKTIKVIDPASFQPSGQFFTEELNLRNLGFTGTSKGFATRLYAYGKRAEDGTPLTFASINDGKPYVEDFSYCDRVISVGWSDERYTNPESLLQEARERLKTLSRPERSYSCDAQNLDDEVWMYKVVTLIDRNRRTRVNHQVVEFIEYPDHSLDKIVLSNTAPSLQSFVNRVTGQIQEGLDKASSSLRDTIAEATEKITGNRGGHFVWVFDSQGRPKELVNLCDADSLEQAKSIWRWNASGLGHSKGGYAGPYTLALLSDGSINASAIRTGILTADLLQTGVLKSKDGKTFFLDLDSGVLKGNFSELSIGSKTVDSIAADKALEAEKNAKTYADSSAANAVNAQTQADIFNKLTKNGTLPGLFMENGQLYINASYLKSGKISAALIDTDSLVAKKLASEDGNSRLAIDSARIQFYQYGKETLTLFTDPTSISGRSYIALSRYDSDGSFKWQSWLHSDEFVMCGTNDNPYGKFRVFVNEWDNNRTSVEVDGVEQDYIVEQSTSGIWTYKKWASGIKECWGNVTHTVTVNRAWGSLYESAAVGNIDFPFTFDSVPTMQLSVVGTSGNSVLIEYPYGSLGNTTASNTGQWHYVRPDAINTSFTVTTSIRAIGG